MDFQISLVVVYLFHFLFQNNLETKLIVIACTQRKAKDNLHFKACTFYKNINNFDRLFDNNKNVNK